MRHQKANKKNVGAGAGGNYVHAPYTYFCIVADRDQARVTDFKKNYVVDVGAVPHRTDKTLNINLQKIELLKKKKRFLLQQQ